MSSLFSRATKGPVKTPGAFPRLEPASDGSGRLYALERVKNLMEVPKNRAIATAPDGALAARIRELDRNCVAVLEIKANQAIVLSTNARGDADAFVALRSLLIGDGIDVLQVLEAPVEVLQTLNKTRRMAAHAVDQSENSITRLMDDIVMEAVQQGASDIHIQQHHSGALVRLRIHGDVYTLRPLPRDQAERLANSAYNSMGEGGSKTLNLSIGQQARVERTLAMPDNTSRTVQLRVQTIPVERDFDLVMRVLQSGLAIANPNFSSLGYSAEQTAELERMLSRPRGLLVMCGPTGSGKSTTLATALAAMVRTYGDRRIIRSIEDPVEYRIDGVRQTSVTRMTEDGMGDYSPFMQMFTHAMRSDPDVIMVGETRDTRTAELLQHAVLSGHYILTSTHAASPVDALNRLAGLGLPRPILAGQDFISGIVHQSLLGLLCVDCKQPYSSVDPAFDRRLENRGIDLSTLFVRGGDAACRTCKGRGVTGRTVVAQILTMDRTFQDLFASNAPQVVLHAWWRANLSGGNAAVSGATLIEQAIDKMQKGIISPLDVEQHLGRIDSETSRAQEAEYVRDWFRRDGRTVP